MMYMKIMKILIIVCRGGLGFLKQLKNMIIYTHGLEYRTS